MKFTVEFDKLSTISKQNIAEVTDQVEILEYLSKDDKWIVRRAVGKNPKTPRKVAEELAKDDDFDVKEAVAQYGDLSEATLEELRKDGNFTVRRAVEKRKR